MPTQITIPRRTGTQDTDTSREQVGTVLRTGTQDTGMSGEEIGSAQSPGVPREQVGATPNNTDTAAMHGSSAYIYICTYAYAYAYV